MSDGRGYGTGQWRGPATIPDRLAPGQPPPPSTGAQGPSISVPFEAWEKQNETIEKVGRALASLQPQFDLVQGAAQAESDGSGTCRLEVYSVAAGIEAQLHRLTVNAINPSTGVPYTAASPFSAATAYLHLHGADSANSTGLWTLIDTWPSSVGGPILPVVGEANGSAAPFLVGPLKFVVHIANGPASTMVYCRYQVSLRRQHGIA